MNDEVARFLRSHPDPAYIDAFVIDLCGNAVGKRYPRDHLEKVYRGEALLCAGSYLLDVTGISHDPLGYGFSDGDPDAEGHPVAGTLKPVPWSAQPAAQCLLTLKEAGTDRPVWFEPRTVLEAVAARFEPLELRPVVAFELEFYLIDARRGRNGLPQPPRNPRTGARSTLGRVYGFDELDDFEPLLDEINAACAAQDIPAATRSSEYGPGQFEVNLDHTDDVPRAADHAALLRRAIRQVARGRGFDATFLSKPFAEEAGSGMHVHVSLVDRNGVNVFDPAAGGEIRLGHAVAGLQATMAEAFAIFAPNVNAFRRFEPNQYVPVTRDWGENNRSVAFRLPAGKGNSRRVEHRVAGAEANPYLVAAAVLAGMHHGLDEELSPGPKHKGNAGAAPDPDLPLALWEAITRLESSRVLADYLGARYIQAYAAAKRSEFAAFMAVPTAREFDWYL